jgi:hypothetical protein
LIFIAEREDIGAWSLLFSGVQYWINIHLKRKLSFSLSLIFFSPVSIHMQAKLVMEKAPFRAVLR